MFLNMLDDIVLASSDLVSKYSPPGHCLATEQLQVWTRTHLTYKTTQLVWLFTVLSARILCPSLVRMVGKTLGITAYSQEKVLLGYPPVVTHSHLWFYPDEQ
jgi:hypothetical protein